ncbi:IucA/IucC family protein, partial [Streptomyces sp. WAC06614]|uniref:IucA/IucC family protein n=1 Tax=Streptomyces sp. WAC06614 TaxID=2487416 RepID=UPI000FAD5869
MDSVDATADAYAAAPLLNCLLREAADPDGAAAGTHRLRASGRLLRVRGGRRPGRAQLQTAAGWRTLSHPELLKLVCDELGRLTGLPNDELLGEMADSREVLAALLAARATATPPADPYLRSEQALVMGHPYHPAPKTRGGGPAASWLPYAPEAHAAFPLTFLALRADQVVAEGGQDAADALDGLAERLGAPPVPAGYRL